MTRARGLILLVVVATISSLFSLTASAVPDDRPPPIRLQAAEFTPGLGERPDVPPGLASRARPPGRVSDYIVQFAGPIAQAWADELDSLGVERLEYLPDFAYRVVMTPAQAARVERSEQVVWVAPFEPAFKLSAPLAAEPGLFTVRIRPGVRAGDVRGLIADTGVEVVEARGRTLTIWAEPDQITELAHLVDVSWIEPFQFQQTLNEYGAGAISGTAAANAAGYDGSTQTIAVADTGFGNGFLDNNHRDIDNGRVTSIQNWPGASSLFCYNVQDDLAVDVSSGHGTHVAGSALGSGGPGPDGEGRGAAPAARLVFQAIENYVDFYFLCEGAFADGYYLIGLPSDLNDLFAAAYNRTARIHSNSWGSSVAGDYTADSAEVDTYTWNNRDMTVVFAAGNDGADVDANGVVDSQSISSPGTAKNAITVGASENDRNGDYGCDAVTYPTCDGQNDVFTYGDTWPADFPVNPLAGDATAGDAEQTASFSSRGPTDDGRIKPDVVAPGTWVLSSFSDQYQRYYDPSPNPVDGAFQYDGWGDPLNPYGKYFGGTSMATPIVAGGAAIVRDHYEKAHGHAASAALVKASLVNSAVDLLDENNDGVHDNDYPIPNDHEGWGRMDAAAATDGTAEWDDDTVGLGTGGLASYSYNVPGGSPLKVTLAWSDYPASETAAVTLVNDLDLVVTAPDGTQYRGNQFSGGWSQPGGSADRLNNLENVYVDAAQSGLWTVQVSGFNVPFGPQPFALVVDGTGTVANTPPSVTITGPADGSTFNESDSITFTGTAADVEDGDLTAGLAWNSDLDGSIGTGGNFTTTLSVGTHTITASVTDGGGLSGSDQITVTVNALNTAPTVTITAPADGSAFTEGDAVTFTGTAIDGEDGDLSASLSWTSDLDGSIGTGGSFTTSTLSAGTHKITASVTDSGGLSGSDQITVTVNEAPNTAPTVTITAPADGSAFTEGDAVTFTGTAIDGEDGDLSASLSWTSDLDGSIGTGGSFTTSTLSVGLHTITASVTDSGGLSGSDQITVTVDPAPNTAPTVTITAPADGSTHTEGTSVSFSGAATDFEDGDLSASLSWTSSTDGVIGSGASFSTSTLSVGEHTITATATDSGGLSGTDQITVTIPVPSVHIGDLDGSSSRQGGRWIAMVRVLVLNHQDQVVSGAEVSGIWTGTVADTCTTDGTGWCSVSRSNIRRRTGSVDFAVANIAFTDHIYIQADNTDPESDSDGTTITVFRP